MPSDVTPSIKAAEAHCRTFSISGKMTVDHVDERTPLLPPVETEELAYRHRYIFLQLLKTASLASALVVLFNLFSTPPSPHTSPPPIDTLVCYSTLNTSRGYASAEALSNNVLNFCDNAARTFRHIHFDWKQSQTYYLHTPDQYTMTVTVSDQKKGFNQSQCIEAMSAIINDCDVALNDINPMNWKQGGKRMLQQDTYQIDIFRQNRPWPPLTKPRQSCTGWYKFILQHYDIYGAGWANHDWGQKSLLPAINPCCGSGSLTGWGFRYFDQPDEHGYEWHSWFNTALGTRRRCFDNSIVQCAAGGPCDSYCGGNG
ncbi:hypothetical protein F5883DRAFT_572749 [Diaporthe sp. PMI_573]|nr:hypothetical protein F5883DRAFT_572749 [Diaporthaceae sp. PMI_573]